MSLLPVVVVVVALLLCYVVYSSNRKESIPSARCWPSFFPKVFDRLSYNSQAPQLIKHGYQKFRDQPFKLHKMDMDLVVIPLKYASELRAVTNDKLDPLTASFDDNAGAVTSILLGSELHTHAIQRRLTPRLPKIIPVMMDELRLAFEQVLPMQDDSWVAVNPYEMVLHLATRAAARVFVGEPTCRDEIFLQTTASYSRNVFESISTSRRFGSLLTSFFGTWVPEVREARDQLQYIQQLLGTEVKRRRESPNEEHDDFLQWCMDLARTEEESQPEALAHRTLGILSMAVVHTTAMASTHLIFDMIADKDLTNSLRKEQAAVLKEGWMSISQQSMLDMKHLDSLMRESQRINPVGEFTFRRLVRKPVTLSDGYQLERGQQIALLARSIHMDEENVPDAATFKPDRWLKQQNSAPTSFSNSSTANLNFGLGRYACPGRFLASYTIKAIMSRLLLEYDFQLQGQFPSGRPPNMLHGDRIFPHRTAVVLLRRRNAVASKA
ncbi:Cytochrome P450 monooxygenase ltmP [Metarhizium brunneum]|uniref:Cytochrome P450 monooxygenase ltmP n=1 Tax=Metarhizium brunneum TaxID=500148 RepID=A0A7D5ZDB5_9HYPO